MSFYFGLDIGQAQDPTAIGIVQRVSMLDKRGREDSAEYHLRHLERVKLGTTYPKIVEHVAGMIWREPLKGEAELVVDATGVGRPVIDLLRDAGLSPVAVTITGGDVQTGDNEDIRVPKRDLVVALQVMLQSGQLKIADGLREAPAFVKELLAFRVKINPLTAHDSYNAREGAHDDLVLAVALACWRAREPPFAFA